MAPSLQPDSQLCMVINLTVEYDPDVLIFVGQRLMTTLDVDDAETPHGQANIFLDEEAFVIRPAVHDAAVHARQHVALDVPVAIGEEDPADSTHRSVLLFRGEFACQLRTVLRHKHLPSFSIDNNCIGV